jgi:hypothetical protein
MNAEEKRFETRVMGSIDNLNNMIKKNTTKNKKTKKCQ